MRRPQTGAHVHWVLRRCRAPRHVGADRPSDAEVSTGCLGEPRVILESVALVQQARDRRRVEPMSHPLPLLVSVTAASRRGAAPMAHAGRRPVPGRPEVEVLQGAIGAAHPGRGVRDADDRPDRYLSAAAPLPATLLARPRGGELGGGDLGVPGNPHRRGVRMVASRAFPSALLLGSLRRDRSPCWQLDARRVRGRPLPTLRRGTDRRPATSRRRAACRRPAGPDHSGAAAAVRLDGWSPRSGRRYADPRQDEHGRGSPWPRRALGVRPDPKPWDLGRIPGGSGGRARQPWRHTRHRWRPAPTPAASDPPARRRHRNRRDREADLRRGPRYGLWRRPPAPTRRGRPAPYRTGLIALLHG